LNQSLVSMSCAATFAAGQYEPRHVCFRYHKTRVYLPCWRFLKRVRCVIIAIT
jgi:hypothetical protein